MDALLEMPPESVDIVITDPAYESLEKHRKRGTTTRLKNSKSSSNTWFKTFPNSRFMDLCEQLYRVLKKDRHCYVMCDDETSDVLKPMLTASGFKVWKRLVWDKGKIGMGYHYRARYEFILFAEKGKRKLADLGVPDVLNVDRVWRGYPTEKPVELGRILIRQSAIPGDVLCDPFMGSGTFGVAAVEEGLSFLGADISPEAHEIAARRMREAAQVAKVAPTADQAPDGNWWG